MSPSCAAGSKNKGPIVFRDAATVSESDEPPLMTIKFPAIIYGDRASPDMNPCFPGNEKSPWKDAHLPSTIAIKQTSLGVESDDTLRERAREDIRAIEKECFGAEFRRTKKIRRQDGSCAIVYRAESRENDRTIKVAYYDEQGEVYRLSLWSSSIVARAVGEVALEMYVAKHVPASAGSE